MRLAGELLGVDLNDALDASIDDFVVGFVGTNDPRSLMSGSQRSENRSRANDWQLSAFNAFGL